jgi:hypothetical protein
MTSGLLNFIKRVFNAIFSNLHIKIMFFTNKISFGNLGNFVIVSDTFILRLTLKVKSQNKYEKS